LVYAAPRSFTGEDACELLVPGSPALVERLLGAIVAFPGVRPAQPGEFSARAFLHGRLTLDQADATLALIAAESAAELHAAREALASPTGTGLEHTGAWADELVNILALVEAGIDFSDAEDARPIAPAAAAARLSVVADGMDATLRRGSRSVPDHRPLVVLFGRPSTGKSSLFNALLGRARAVAAPEAGTTRDVLREPWGPRSAQVTLADAPGVLPPSAAGPAVAAPSPADAGAQATAAHALARADVVVWCDPTGRFDLSGPGPSPWPESAQVVRVITMADRAPPATPLPAALRVSVVDGRNLAELRRRVLEAAHAAAQSAQPHTLALSPRQVSGLVACRAAVDAAAAAAREARPDEVLASELRMALDSLAVLRGHVSPDEVLGRVFAAFCIGK
jgi:tRNA modification GTPase